MKRFVNFNFKTICLTFAVASALLYVLSFYRLSVYANSAMQMSESGYPTVIIDAGHGDFDPGAIAADGSCEKDINLDIALKLKDIFEANGFSVICTRTDDTTLADGTSVSILQKKRTDTRNRVKLAADNTPCVMLSIHQNSFSDKSQHGAQLFFGTENEYSKKLCECIKQSIVSNLQPWNTREVKKGTGEVYILTHCTVPTALIECGFISNEEELTLLKDDDYRQKVAFSIFVGFCNYLLSGDLSQ